MRGIAMCVIAAMHAIIVCLPVHITALDEKGCWRYGSRTCICISSYLVPLHTSSGLSTIDTIENLIEGLREGV